jgi:hypothetical protein
MKIWKTGDPSEAEKQHFLLKLIRDEIKVQHLSTHPSTGFNGIQS